MTTIVDTKTVPVTDDDSVGEVELKAVPAVSAVKLIKLSVPELTNEAVMLDDLRLICSVKSVIIVEVAVLPTATVAEIVVPSIVMARTSPGLSVALAISEI